MSRKRRSANSPVLFSGRTTANAAEGVLLPRHLSLLYPASVTVADAAVFFSRLKSFPCIFIFFYAFLSLHYQTRRLDCGTFD